MSHTDDTLFQDICTFRFRPMRSITTLRLGGVTWSTPGHAVAAIGTGRRSGPPPMIVMDDPAGSRPMGSCGLRSSGTPGSCLFRSRNSLAWIRIAGGLPPRLGPAWPAGRVGPGRSAAADVRSLARAGGPGDPSRRSRAPFLQKGLRISTHGTQRNQAPRRKPTARSRRWGRRSPINRSASWPRSSSC